jgi:hypothetical protein
MARLSKSAVLKVKVTKFSEEMGIIWGWASVADLKDLQGDTVQQPDLVKGMYQFMEDYYTGAAVIKENHADVATVVLVESTLQFIAGCVCWFVGVKLLTEDLREAARTGQISGFSIAGTADAEED